MIRHLVALRCDYCPTINGGIFDADDEQQMLTMAAKASWKVRRTCKDITYGHAICPACVRMGRDFPTPASPFYVPPPEEPSL